MRLLIVVVLVLLVVGAFPAWPHSRAWGHAPFGVVGAIVVVVIVLMLVGRL